MEKERQYKEESNRYEDCSKEELIDLLLRAQRLEEEGVSMTSTIIKVEEALEKKVDSGIVYEANPNISPSPKKHRPVLIQ